VSSTSSSGPLEGLTFLVDESVGAKIVPEALRELGAEVYTVTEKFGQGTPDEQWLEEAGVQGWVVLTRDRMIRRRPNELGALSRAGVRAFALTAGAQTGQAAAELLRLRAKKIRNYCRSESPPFLVTLTATQMTREKLR
jgi:hypothetical protein